MQNGEGSERLGFGITSRPLDKRVFGRICLVRVKILSRVCRYRGAAVVIRTVIGSLGAGFMI